MNYRVVECTFAIGLNAVKLFEERGESIAKYLFYGILSPLSFFFNVGSRLSNRLRYFLLDLFLCALVLRTARYGALGECKRIAAITLSLTPWQPKSDPLRPDYAYFLG